MKWIQDDGYCSFAYDGKHKSFHVSKEGVALKIEQLRHNIEWRETIVAQSDDPITKAWFGQQLPLEREQLAELEAQ